MRICRYLTIAAVLLLALTACPRPVAAQRAVLLEARDLAYDANYRNDQAGLRAAIAALEPLTASPGEGAHASYYLSWAYWALAGSQVQARDTAGALESGKRAVAHARAAVAARAGDADFHAALANALIVVAILDPPQFRAVATELAGVRRRALELGPDNPRVVMMDAGMIFNNPPERGGGRERGLARWQEALRLFEAEANASAVDPVAPRWGQALAHGWMAGLYLATAPPQQERARAAADAALRMRPDFWWVREQVLPRLRE
jgi:hypothetical protein